MLIIPRRHFLRGLLAAPAVAAAGSLMPVRSIDRLLAPPNYYVGNFTWVMEEWTTRNLAMALISDENWVPIGDVKEFTVRMGPVDILTDVRTVRRLR